MFLRVSLENIFQGFGIVEIFRMMSILTVLFEQLGALPAIRTVFCLIVLGFVVVLFHVNLLNIRLTLGFDIKAVLL